MLEIYSQGPFQAFQALDFTNQPMNPHSCIKIAQRNGYLVGCLKQIVKNGQILEKPILGVRTTNYCKLPAFVKKNRDAARQMPELSKAAAPRV